MAWLFQPLLPGGAQQQAGGGGPTTLTADAGSIALAGQAVVFAGAMVSSNGSIAPAGQAALFMTTLTVETGTIVIAGFSVPNPNAGAEQPSGPAAGTASSGSRQDTPRFARTRWKKR